MVKIKMEKRFSDEIGFINKDTSIIRKEMQKKILIW